MKVYGGVDVYIHIFLISVLVVVNFTPKQLYPRGKSHPYPFDRRLNGPQNRSGRHGEEKILDPTGTRNQTPLLVQPVASSYPTALSRLPKFISDHSQNSEKFISEQH
jgi:hypothetical protein